MYVINLYNFRAHSENRHHIQLVDNNKVEVASFKSPGLIGKLKGAPPVLAISPAGFPIMDDIVVTFAFVEARRRAGNSEAATAAGTASVAFTVS